MGWKEFWASVIGDALSWPVAFVVVVLVLLGPIKGLINGIEAFKGYGADVRFRERVREIDRPLRRARRNSRNWLGRLFGLRAGELRIDLAFAEELAEAEAALAAEESTATEPVGEKPSAEELPAEEPSSEARDSLTAPRRSEAPQVGRRQSDKGEERHLIRQRVPRQYRIRPRSIEERKWAQLDELARIDPAATVEGAWSIVYGLLIDLAIMTSTKALTELPSMEPSIIFRALWDTGTDSDLLRAARDLHDLRQEVIEGSASPSSQSAVLYLARARSAADVIRSRRAEAVRKEASDL